MPEYQINLALMHALAFILAGIACISDLRSRRIPNALVAIGVVLGLSLNASFAGLRGIGWSLAGGGLGLALFLPFFAFGGMGGGDVKLLAGLGAFLGPREVVGVALAAALTGGLLALAVAVRERRLLETLKGIARLLRSWATLGTEPVPDLSLQNPAALKIPYAVPLAAGALFVALTGGGW